MKRFALIGGALLIGISGYTQYCDSGGPSSTADSNLEGLSITGDAGSINYVGCPAVTGVQFYGTETVTLGAGSSYVMNIQFGTCDGNFASVAEVWIDYNGNELFEASESIFTWSGQPMTSPTGYVVNVPANVVSGTHRMRVMQAEQVSLPLDPCASFTWGSVTDFNITFTGGIDCSSYIGDSRFNARAVTSIPFSEDHNSAVCYTSQNAAYNAPDVFYKIVPNGLAALKVSLCGSSFDTFLSIQDQNGTGLFGNDDATNCGTSSEIEFLATGYDTLYAVVEGWGVASGDYTIEITEAPLSLQKNEPSTLGLYPNPANDILRFESVQNGRLQFFSTQGQHVYETILNNANEVNVAHLPRGLYLVTLTNDTTIAQQKVIIE